MASESGEVTRPGAGAQRGQEVRRTVRPSVTAVEGDEAAPNICFTPTCQAGLQTLSNSVLSAAAP